MDYLFVDGSTDRKRKAVIALEGRERTRVADYPFSRPINFYRTDTWFNHTTQTGQHETYERSGGPHLFDLPFRLANNHKNKKPVSSLFFLDHAFYIPIDNFRLPRTVNSMQQILGSIILEQWQRLLVVSGQSGLNGFRIIVSAMHQLSIRMQVAVVIILRRFEIDVVNLAAN